MSENRFRSGVLITIAWLGGLAWIAFSNATSFQNLRPNEWADFLAGAFAPMAFFWLILGYLQQGEELRLSTKALLLQAEELKNSVEQQRELVEVSRLQVEGERAALAHQEKLRLDASKPKFVLSTSGGSFRGDGQSNYTIHFGNVGATVTNVNVTLECGEAGVRTILTLPIFIAHQDMHAGIALNEPFPESPQAMDISYRDTHGAMGRCSYSVKRETSHSHASLEITETAA